MAAISQQPEDGEEGGHDEVRATMCPTHNKAVEFYCRDHNAPACATCKLMSHRKCQLQDLEQAATGATERNLETLEQLRETKTHMKKIGELVGKEIETLEVQKDEAIEKIKRKMKELESLAKKEIAEVEGKFKQKCEGMDKEACNIKESTMLVEKSISELERATNCGSKEEIFLATIQAEDNVLKFQDIVSSSNQVSHTETCFEVDNRLTDITSIGILRVEESSINVDLTPAVSEVLNTQQCNEQIMWFDVLPNGQMILLSWDVKQNKSQLSLYSANKEELLSQLDLPLAGSATMLDDDQLIVPLLNPRQLQIVNLDNTNLTKGDSVKTVVRSRLVLKYSDSFVLVLAQQRDGKYCLQILDLTGKVEMHIQLSTDLQAPWFMRMSRERSAVYIVDQDKGCLGFNMIGSTVFHYSSTDYDNYAGLAVDLHQALYFTAGKHNQGSKCVIKLSPTGQVLRQIDINLIYPVQCTKNKLYVASLNDQLEHIISCFYV